jgi:hypothetical protein
MFSAVSSLCTQQVILKKMGIQLSTFTKI